MLIIANDPKRVFQFCFKTSRGYIISDINDENYKKEVHPNNVFLLDQVRFGNLVTGKVLEQLYDLEMAGEEIPAPEELHEMKNLALKLEISLYPVDLSKIVQWYYQIMEYLDKFEDNGN